MYRQGANKVLITVNLGLMVHESGSKFYEIAAFSCEAMNSFLTVRRWGKVGSAKTGGGELKMERWSSERQAVSHMDKVFKARDGYSFHHGSYYSSGLGTGMHQIEHGFLSAALLHHYESPNTARAILTDLRLTNSNLTDLRLTDTAKVPEKAAVFVPPPKPVRGESWGSW